MIYIPVYLFGLFFITPRIYLKYAKYFDVDTLPDNYYPISIILMITQFLLVGFLGQGQSPMFTLGWALISNALVAVLWLDFKFKIIPDEIQLIGLCGAILTCVFGSKFIGFVQIGVGALLPLFLILINFIYNRVSGKEGIGLGDVKLLLWLSVLAGASVFKVFVYSIILSIPFTLFIAWKKGRHEAFPYGPWIVLSFIALEVLKSQNEFDITEYSRMY